MKNTLLILFLLLIMKPFFGQKQSDSIEVRKKLGTSYFQKGIRLAPKQLKELMLMNPAAHKEMTLAKTNYDVAYVFASAGGALIGWPIGTAIAGGDPEVELAAIGVIFLVVSIPFSVFYNQHTKNAVRLYNNGLAQTASARINFRIGFRPNGVGIRMVF